MATLIGLTGGIASGKSTIANMFKRRGFTVIDADVAARAVVEPGEEAYKQVVKAFGSEILLEDGAINRKKLGSIIFHDQEKRQQLNQIVHPAVREKMNDWKEAAIAEGKETIIYDIPLLFESNLTHLVSKIILVFVEQSVQLERLMVRNQLSKDDALARIASQWPLQDKKRLSDAIIDNNRSIEESEIQLDQLIEKWELNP
ncbi:dephospho-CoA kinase [Bacillus sp. FJAT-50079]|uniref:dephospho-CoA kinase n=1 Tax=Bacillus sp. FJAT-50079 TaxID=2833577 RepID=UPI001BC9B184|nr:dephospho-CoA kinase [Bacillus sp. FJAT-50079]MBS4208799.1 dephospho-CoA kinase [Bacillus sp. FJAT-50079]